MLGQGISHIGMLLEISTSEAGAENLAEVPEREILARVPLQCTRKGRKCHKKGAAQVSTGTALVVITLSESKVPCNWHVFAALSHSIKP